MIKKTFGSPNQVNRATVLHSVEDKDSNRGNDGEKTLSSMNNL